MVGTNAMRSPLRRHCDTRSRNSCGRTMTSNANALPMVTHALEAVLCRRIFLRLHGLRIRLDRFQRAVAAGEEILGEARLAARSDVEHVVEHEDLSVGIRPRADADDGN